MTRLTPLLAAACALCFVPSAPAPASAQQAERRTLRGAEIAIYNLAGRVTVERAPAGGSDVVVEITRGGADASRLEIATGAVRGRETLRVIYPDDHISYTGRPGFGSSSTLRVADDGTFGDADGDQRRGFRRGGREVRITTRGGGLEAHADLRILMPAGQNLAVYLGVGEAAVTGVEGDLRVDVASADVSATRTRGRLVLDTGSGEIEISEHDGEALLETGSGEVNAARVRGPSLNIETGSGGVTVDAAEVDKLLIDTGSGSVDATAVRSRDVLVDTGSGSVTLTVLTDVESLNIDTGSGSVTLTLPPTVGATVDIETGSGDIDLGFPVEATRLGHSHLQGKIGDGQGRIVIETGSGSVRLRRT
jgi:hypothetical protein